MIFELDNYAHEIREPGGKLYMILSEKEEITENGIEVSEEVLEELYKMEDKFVKLYPNPFTDALFISYSLSEDSIIKLEVASIESGFKKVLEPEKKQVKGAYIYYLGNNDLKKGVYVVTVYVNGERKTETIVKK
ncbi:T9SS type A sorting domain-containing protein [Tenacibaculum maritimum]|uniref:T9SS type A sorting domain-containing protein n=1 Tax=Tenacibaculum maritimum TaxID=107401 RepID=UPI001330CB85|nr:T9SS type A sorting domain-containing protein [Tenacibaculum maritimum]MCD9583124.1 T9SS type A sorting domain-containing protein [Tenacibaculum maritimum]MCD9637100.1 T9SS type A sorting domain-containing protein [Tenacibaculum maritimum]